MDTIIRRRAREVHGYVSNAGYSQRSRPDIGLSRLVDELVIAFFVAMAIMWVVTSITGIFS
jgi:hypothetical protein